MQALSGDNYNRSRSQPVAVLVGGVRRWRLLGGMWLDPATCYVVRETGERGDTISVLPGSAAADSATTNAPSVPACGKPRKHRVKSF